MTTILADYKRRVMVADSCTTDGSRIWKTTKVHRINGALVGLAGTAVEGESFLVWFRAGMETPPDFAFDGSTALVLDMHGLYTFDMNTIRLSKVRGGIEAAGSGAMAAICAYEGLGFKDPAKAVRIACRHDHGSRPPVRTYSL